MGKFAALMKLTRIEHGFIAAFATSVGCAIGAGGWFGIQPYAVVLAIVVTVLVEVGLFVFNDICNIEEDRINAPERPLVKGEISVKEATIVGLLSLILGASLALPLGFPPLLVVLLAVSTGLAYDMWLKKAGFIGNLIVALDTALPFLFGATVFSGFSVPILTFLLAGIAFLAVLGREVLKGIVDIEGDLKAGVRTLAITRGVNFAAIVSSLLFMLAVSLSLVALPLVTEGRQYLYTFFVAITDLMFTYVAGSLLLRRDKSTAAKGRVVTLIAMFTGTLAFAITA
ncbi:MAG: UbiA family prenyltransferase [Thermofilaceae archaeon]|nr:UbiA family prenyltransferase [Thermofilaceae archaeon]MDW8004536.1 UbiA family prenyltransferase [Thermofilaceae archaeon]